MIYTNSEHVPKAIHEALDSMGSYTAIKVPSMLASIVRNLDKATSGSRHNPVDLEDGDPMAIDSDNTSEPEDDFDDQPDSDDDAWSSKQPVHDWQNSAPTSGKPEKSIMIARAKTIRSDLKLAKEAGFRISLLGSLMDGGHDGFVSLSIRINKLGISDEALQAWHMDAAQYFILLIRYSDGYQSLDSIIGGSLSSVSNSMTMKVGVSDKYKVSIDEAIAAFAKLEDKSKTKKLLTETPASSTPRRRLGRLFIGRPLDELLNDRFIPLVRYRLAMGFPWGGAEQFFNDHQGRNLDNNAPDPRYWAEDENAKAGSFPLIVTMDHLTSTEKDQSLPLLVMQFALRHLVRCTEFCLVCHCKVEADFEALKPYVCSKPLCLYQYMNLGFGPSIEHEIITQPHVVDLLISFCYASSYTYKLRYLPTGMALMVPAASPSIGADVASAMDHFMPLGMLDGSLHGARDSQSQEISSREMPYKARFDSQTRDLLFPPLDRPPLKVGSWITYNPPGQATERYHAKVKEVYIVFFQNVLLPFVVACFCTKS